MGNISFEYYKVPDQLDNVVNLSLEMIFSKRPERLLKDTYSEHLIYKIDQQEIAQILG